MKLCELAEASIRLLKKHGKQGIRSDEIADILRVPRRRVYDVIAVLKALGMVSTKRRIDGTTVTWNDPLERLVPKAEYDGVLNRLKTAEAARADLQVENAELKEMVRQLRSTIRDESLPTELHEKVHYNTSCLSVKCVGCGGFKRVTNAGIEVIIESNRPGLVVDPTPPPSDEDQAIMKLVRQL